MGEELGLLGGQARGQCVLGVVVLADVEAFQLQPAEVVGPLAPAAVRVAGGAGQLLLLLPREGQDPADALVEVVDDLLRYAVVDDLDNADLLGGGADGGEQSVGGVVAEGEFEVDYGDL